jgi:hypothetical protein
LPSNGPRDYSESARILADWGGGARIPSNLKIPIRACFPSPKTVNLAVETIGLPANLGANLPFLSVSLQLQLSVRTSLACIPGFAVAAAVTEPNRLMPQL